MNHMTMKRAGDSLRETRGNPHGDRRVYLAPLRRLSALLHTVGSFEHSHDPATGAQRFVLSVDVVAVTCMSALSLLVLGGTRKTRQ